MTALFDDDQVQIASRPSSEQGPAEDSVPAGLARTDATPPSRVQVWGDPIPPPHALAMLAGSGAVYLMLAAAGYAVWRWLGA